MNNYDSGFLGGESEVSAFPSSSSNVDPGLPRSDYLEFEKCLLCGTSDVLLKNKSYPYCDDCFSWKKEYFPSRPQQKKKTEAHANLGKSEETNNEASQPSTSSSTSNIIILNKCKVCQSNPENGLFVHFTTAHLYGCYKCAKTIFHGIKKCPQCQERAHRVAKLLI